jgi:hypothetical protein
MEHLIILLILNVRGWPLAELRTRWTFLFFHSFPSFTSSLRFFSFLKFIEALSFPHLSDSKKKNSLKGIDVF